MKWSPQNLLMVGGGVGDKGNSGSRVVPHFQVGKQADGVPFAGIVKAGRKQMEGKSIMLC